MKKILVIRFSSIGDIVLTTPVVRCLKEQTGAEIYFLTKKAFTSLVEHNPFVKKVLTFDKDLSETIKQIRSIGFDHIVDLHKNFRSKRVVRELGIPAVSYDKRSIDRWLLVHTKWDRLNGDHIVDRYFHAVKSMGVLKDEFGLELYFPSDYKPKLNLPNSFYVFIIGAAHATKNIPSKYYVSLLQVLKKPILLIGGKEYRSEADEISKVNKQFINLVGKTNLLESAWIVKQSDMVLGPDTGMTHIAAAFQKKQIVVYGSTHSALGFRPYKNPNARIIEHGSLHCRPCTKQGRASCPKGHFRCMLDLKEQDFVDVAVELIEK